MNRPSDLSDLRIDLDAALSHLTPRQRQAVMLYANGCTQGEIAELLGVTQGRVSQIFKELLIKTPS